MGSHQKRCWSWPWKRALRPCPSLGAVLSTPSSQGLPPSMFVVVMCPVCASALPCSAQPCPTPPSMLQPCPALLCPVCFCPALLCPALPCVLLPWPCPGPALALPSCPSKQLFCNWFHHRQFCHGYAGHLLVHKLRTCSTSYSTYMPQPAPRLSTATK